MHNFSMLLVGFMLTGCGVLSDPSEDPNGRGDEANGGGDISNGDHEREDDDVETADGGNGSASSDDDTVIGDEEDGGQEPACIPSEEVCDGADNNCNDVVDDVYYLGCISCNPDLQGECGVGGGCRCNEEDNWECIFFDGECEQNGFCRVSSQVEICEHGCGGSGCLGEPDLCEEMVCERELHGCNWEQDGNYTCSADTGTCHNGDCEEITIESWTPIGVACTEDADCANWNYTGCDCLDDVTQYCAMSERTCGADGWCTMIEYVQDCTCDHGVCRDPHDEICNGVDDDFDGVVDNGFHETGTGCYWGDGVCRRFGVMACQPDGSNACVDPDTNEPIPMYGFCEDGENKCTDGDPDDSRFGQYCETEACRGELCAPVPGVLDCGLGALICIPDCEPSETAANGLDDDCDGYLDEVGPDNPRCEDHDNCANCMSCTGLICVENDDPLFCSDP